MSRSRFRAAWLALVGVLVLLGPARADHYTIGVVPQFDARRIADTWLPITRYLSEATGHEFVLRGAPTIPHFERELRNGDYDFAFMNPYHLVQTIGTSDYRPLVRDGNRALYGVLVTARDSRFDTLDSLEGAIIAFPAPNALGASLLMRAVLARQYGLSFEERYVQTHDSAYLNVALGETAAAGGVKSTFDSQPAELRNRLQIIFETPRVAPHPFAVHPRVPETMAAKVRDALIALGSTEEGRALLAGVPIQQPVPAEASDYAPIAELGLEEFAVE
ncbi:phosphate/phosphite/phosphonate ABC transporter substrate-binding protein [Mesobacterium pallidum]|uniref:phosphate/phosphite/phosphonate ABC transporter substrate-binding protein n=1 Tax=Mesobacterium pallidum TaxID=2872037 RepID=UPI001EE157C7|nr:phosphate/phosphite/phosphonate ABC transporter substrate-binding protein [Mesobacterium pallidum]